MKIIRVTEVWQLFLVFEIRKEAFVEGQSIPLNQEFDEVYGESYHYVLLYEEEQGIGTARINLTNSGYGKIERVAVIPTYQGKGWGRKVIEAAEEWIKEAGYTKAVITSQLKAASFYEKIGYIIQPDSQTEGVIQTVYTEKELLNTGGGREER